MCGIAAIISSFGDASSDVRRMADALAHRGPDDAGVWLGAGCALGHRRLSVIDIAGGRQPMVSTDGRLVIVFNGEIYNYRDLRARMVARGRTFHTSSDTEVVLEGFQLYGEDVVHHLNGQFAFLIWDTARSRAFAARDRMGEKPLYWARPSELELVIASDVRGVLSSGRVQPRLNLDAVQAYLALNYVPTDVGIYANVQPVPPAHRLTWESGTVTLERYWQPAYSTNDISPDEAAHQVRELLEAAVQRQTTAADVEVGCFLSGGRDSATVAALMAEHGKSLDTFSVGFGDLIDELPFARAVAKTYKTSHNELQMDIPVADTLERVTDAFDEPFGDSSNIPTFLIAEFARHRVKVVLSGDGGDELFGGYEWYRSLVTGHEAGSSPFRVAGIQARTLLIRALAKAGIGSPERTARALHESAGIELNRRFADPFDRHIAFVRNTVDARVQGTNEAAASLLDRLYRPTDHIEGLDRAIDFDLRCYLPGDILTKVDRASMAHGLEVRSPFLDAQLVDFVLSLPVSIRLDRGSSKPLLAAAVGDLWPKVIRGRSKQGFGAPLDAWLKRPDVSALEHRVLRVGSPLMHLFEDAVTRPSSSQARWNLMCLGLWLERHPECLRLG
jgi:asparagine synthase (glutamine-hydrolysing)